MGAQDVVDRFLARQREMYAGGSAETIAAMLAPDVVWHVPGDSPIAGEHRGREAVLTYFARRRALAGGAIAIAEHERIAHADTVVQLADGRARLGGRERTWRTAGVYRVADGRIAEAWLVPLEAEDFDAAWGATRGEPLHHARHVGAADCDASGAVGPGRLVELFEGALAELLARQGCDLDRFGLSLARLDLQRRTPVRAGSLVGIDVFVEAVGSTWVSARCVLAVGEGPSAASCRGRWVCADPSGAPTAWSLGVAQRLERLSGLAPAP